MMQAPTAQAQRYLEAVPGAVSGNGGHDATFRAALLLVQDFALDREAAMAVLREWNGRCDPPWSEADLDHKIDDAIRAIDPARLGSRVNGNGNGATMPADPLEQLAGRRGWSTNALHALGAKAEGGEVRFPMRDAKGEITGWRRRRGDGQAFQGGAKVLTVKGGKNGLICPWPIPTGGPILLVEGEADATAAITAGHGATVATPGATPGHRVVETLQAALAGRDVVLAPDPDEAGQKWQRAMGAALVNAACNVRYIPALPNMDLDDRLKRADDRAAELKRLMDGTIPWKPAGDEGEGDQGELDIFDARGRLIPLNVAQNIMRARHIIHVGGAFHEYDGGVYRRREDYVYEREAVAMVGPSIKRNALADVVKLLRVQTAIGPDDLYSSGRIINLENGLLDLDRGLEAHTPEHVSTVQIPIAFDPAAKCPLWSMALGQWFPGEPDVVELLQEWAGYCLVPDTRQHKAMVLIGEGANGKSVFCDVLKSLVGHENVSAVSLNALGRSFALAELHGKLANLTIEADIRDGIDEANFKACVAGDPIQAERKFRDPFVFRPFARFTIAMNNLFHVDDRSDGFYRRLLLVRFNERFSEDQADRDLPDKLAAELPGIFNWALEGLARLEQRGRFTIPQRVRDEVAEYRRHNNPVATWAEECCELGDVNAWTSSADLYASFKKWATDNGHRPMASNKFGTELKRLRGVVAVASPDRLVRTRGYGGIELCD